MFPNWGGCDAAIVASGTSAKKAGVELLAGKVKVMAIKRSLELAPFADAVYGCDAPWWRSVNGLPKYNGLKLSYDANLLDPAWGVTKVDIPDKYSNDLKFDEVGKVGAGGNSGFQALNLVAQFGARRIILIGFDAEGRSGAHWYGRNNWTMANNPTEENFRRWIIAFNWAAKQLDVLGIEVVNASEHSAIKSFKKKTVEQTLRNWGL